MGGRGGLCTQQCTYVHVQLQPGKETLSLKRLNPLRGGAKSFSPAVAAATRGGVLGENRKTCELTLKSHPSPALTLKGCQGALNKTLKGRKGLKK